MSNHRLHWVIRWLQNVFNVGDFQDLASVLGSPDNVVLATVCAVTELGRHGDYS